MLFVSFSLPWGLSTQTYPWSELIGSPEHKQFWVMMTWHQLHKHPQESVKGHQFTLSVLWLGFFLMENWTVESVLIWSTSWTICITRCLYCQRQGFFFWCNCYIVIQIPAVCLCQLVELHVGHDWTNQRLPALLRREHFVESLLLILHVKRVN